MGAKKQFVLPSLFLLPHSLSSSPLSPSSTSSYFWLLVFFWLGTRIPKYTEIPALAQEEAEDQGEDRGIVPAAGEDGQADGEKA